MNMKLISSDLHNSDSKLGYSKVGSPSFFLKGPTLKHDLQDSLYTRPTLLQTYTNDAFPQIEPHIKLSTLSVK